MLYARIIGVVIGILLATGSICACGLIEEENDKKSKKEGEILTEETLVEEILVEEIQVNEIKIK